MFYLMVCESNSKKLITYKQLANSRKSSSLEWPIISIDNDESEDGHQIGEATEM
jgi:hypothetical protein